MKTKSILFVCIALPTLMCGQVAEDAYRFSQTHVTGTSRNQALGGAMGALGVDVSNAATNPAGLGISTKGEFYFTPVFYSVNSTSNYLGNTESANKFKFGVNGLGLSLVSDNYRKGDDYKRIGISFAINNVARFSETRDLSGINKGATFVDGIVNRLNKNNFTLNFDPFKDKIFFDYAAFDTVAFKDTATRKRIGEYISNFGVNRAINQNITENVSGYINSFDISLFGTPNSDKLYLGASLGIPILRYESNFALKDEDKSNINGASYSLPLKGYDYSQKVITEGNGINLKIGLVYRATDFFRIGGYIHTPTLYSLKDLYSSKATVRLYPKDTIGAIRTYSGKSPDGNYEYKMITPFRAGLNLGFVIGKYAALGIDYETIGYNQASLSENGNSTSTGVFKSENNSIKNKFERTENVRAGLEINVKPIKLRLGYNILGTGLSNATTINKYNQQLSGGIGFSEGKWYFDAAFTKAIAKYNYVPYEYGPTANVTKTSSFGSVTIGVRF
jgi:hypothetical protein